MINTLVKNENQSKLNNDALLNEFFVLPKLVKVSSFSLEDKKFLFFKKSLNMDLYSKFSPRTQLEKYILKAKNGIEIANMDLKVYKDCVYIINMECKSGLAFKQIINYFIQVAVEKALNCTTDKKVNINLSYPLVVKNKIKNILEETGFEPEKYQSGYEKTLFGENYFLSADKNLFWNKKIKQIPVFVNNK